MRKLLVIVLLAIIVGFNTGKAVVFLGCNTAIFSSMEDKGEKIPVVTIVDEYARYVVMINMKDVLVIKYVPDNLCI